MSRPQGSGHPKSLEGWEAIDVGGRHQALALRPGFLAVTCWCEARYFYVPAQWVLEGRTAACSPKCLKVTLGRPREPRPERISP
jgi:hypothetical protein